VKSMVIWLPEPPMDSMLDATLGWGSDWGLGPAWGRLWGLRMWCPTDLQLRLPRKSLMDRQTDWRWTSLRWVAVGPGRRMGRCLVRQ